MSRTTAVMMIACLGGGLLARQQGAVHMADVSVPGPADAVSFVRPATPYSAFNAFVKALEAAGVRHGVEGPACDPATPPIDFARPFERAVPLGGRRLGDALDEIVKASPQYRWFDDGGTIVVRASAAGSGLLDRRLSRFAISNATPREALDALVTTLDPARAPGAGIQERAAGAVSPAAPPVRKVTLSLRDVTVQAALQALAREYGTFAWTVNYDGVPADVATATIAFTTPSGFVRAVSAERLRTQALDPSGRFLLGIQVPFKDILLNYAERARISINIEEVQASGNRAALSALLSGMPPLALPEANDQAVARIVALDSRYEWSQEGGRFLVRPKAGEPGRSDWLDKTLPELSARNEPAGDLIERLANMIGPTSWRGGSSAGLPPGAAADAMATRLDIHLDGPVTLRAGLNAIADTTGWMWSVRPDPPTGRPTALVLEWRGRTEPPTGGRRGTAVPPIGNSRLWTMALLVATSADRAVPPSAPPPPYPLPPSSFVPPPPPGPRPTMPVYLELPATADSVRHVLDGVVRNRGDVPMGLELVTVGTPGLPTAPSRERVDLTGLTMDETFARLRELVPDYLFTLDKGVYHVRPRDAQRDSTPWLNQRVARFQQRFESMREAVTAVAHIGLPKDASSPSVNPSSPTRFEPLLQKSIAVSLTNATVRDILDEIARQHGAMRWIVTQRVASSGPILSLGFSGPGWNVGASIR